MSWPLFAVVQLALTTIGVAVAFWLRNRELSKQVELKEQAVKESAGLLEQAADRFDSVAEDSLNKWLAERTMEFDEDDAVQMVQKLVLQNEKQPIPDFADAMHRRIAAGAEAQEQVREQWLQLRLSTYDHASGLIERFPRSHPAIVQLYEAYSSLDGLYGVEMPALPEPVVNIDEEASELEEAEHLRGTNELLHQRLQEAEAETVRLRAIGRDLQQQEGDLKALLQQFTKDSRDMMTCIQELERENRQLRDETAGVSAEDAA